MFLGYVFYFSCRCFFVGKIVVLLDFVESCYILKLFLRVVMFTGQEWGALAFFVCCQTPFVRVDMLCFQFYRLLSALIFLERMDMLYFQVYRLFV